MPVLPQQLLNLHEQMTTLQTPESAWMIINEYCSVFAAQHVHGHLWTLTVGAMSSDHLPCNDSRLRADLLFFFEFTKIFTEAVYLLNDHQVSTKNPKKLCTTYQDEYLPQIKSILHSFFDIWHLESVNELLWDFTKSAVNPSTKLYLRQVDDFFYLYENLKKLLTALDGFYMVIRSRDKTGDVSNNASPAHPC